MAAPQDDLPELLRAAWRHRPAGVNALSARSGSLDLASTVTDVVSTSLHPPMILVCVYSESRLRDSLDEGSPWALSILDGSGAAMAAARQLAEPGRPLIGQLTGLAYRRGEASGAALLEAANAWIECRTAWVRNAGDHDVIVADVLNVQLREIQGDSLVHHRGRISSTRL